MASAKDELTELAAAAATSMASAVGTGLWLAVKQSVLRLLSRSPARRAQLAAALEQHAAAHAALADAAARTQFIQFWTGALEELVREDPALRPGLADLAAGPAVARNSYQQNTAHGSGTVYANQHGSLHIHHPSPREPQ